LILYDLTTCEATRANSGVNYFRRTKHVMLFVGKVFLSCFSFTVFQHAYCSSPLCSLASVQNTRIRTVPRLGYCIGSSLVLTLAFASFTIAVFPPVASSFRFVPAHVIRSYSLASFTCVFFGCFVHVVHVIPVFVLPRSLCSWFFSFHPLCSSLYLFRFPYLCFRSPRSLCSRLSAIVFIAVNSVCTIPVSVCSPVFVLLPDFTHCVSGCVFHLPHSVFSGCSFRLPRSICSEVIDCSRLFLIYRIRFGSGFIFCLPVQYIPR